MRSTARSTSVTRSMVPFLFTCRAVPRPAICMSPARTTASMAVVRKIGRNGTQSSLGGVAGGQHAFDHAHFHAALGRALQLHFVHEVANQEDAAAAGLEQVL